MDNADVEVEAGQKYWYLTAECILQQFCYEKKAQSCADVGRDGGYTS